MADDKVEIQVITKADLSEVEGLEELVDEIKSKVEEGVELNLQIDQATAELEEATAEVERLQEELANIELGESDADFSEITSQLEEAESKVEELSEELDTLNDKSIVLEVDSSQLDDANDKVQETEDSLSNVKTALVGLVATAEIEHMATVADNINTSWNRLSLTFEGTEVTMDALKDKVSEVNAETSRGAGTVREYFNQMGIAGVINVNLLAESFESLSGKAYQTGNSIESMESKMQTMVLTGNASEKMLKSLGLSAEDLANAIGVSVDELSDAFDQLSPEQRLQAITNAMGDGAQANEMYGNSYEAMKAKAEAAMSGLEGAVGQAILPNVIPVLDTATQAVKGLTDGFKNLPEPVQGAIGTVMGVSAIATTGIGMFGDFAESIANLGDAYGVLKKVYEALIPTEIAEGTAGWFSIGWIAAAILLGIALGLAFIYLYENCDWFREAVDSLAATLQWLGQVIYSSVVGAIEWLSQEFKNFTSQIGLNTNDWKQAVLGFILFLPQLPLKVGELLINALAKALGFKGNFTQTMRDAASNAVNNFVTWITSLPGRLWEELQKMLDMARDFAMDIANILTGGAAGMVIGWITGSGEHSPGFMYDALVGELQAMANAPGEYLSQLIDAVSEHGYEMANAFSEAVLGMDLETAFATLIAPLIELQTAVQGFADYVLSLGGLIPADVEITGNSVIDTILRVLGFVATLPLQIGMYLMNIVAEAIGFGQNFSQNMIMSAWNAVSGFTSHVMRLPGQLASFLNSAIGHAVSFAGSLPSRLMQAGSNAVSQFTSAVANLPNGFKNELSEIISAATNFVGNIGSILYNAGVNAIQNFLAGLDRHSPGKMQREFRAEITEMGDSVPGDSRKLLSNVKNLGESIVDEFGTPGLQFGFEHTANSELEKAVGSITGTTVNLNLEIGTVDNEDRITEIIERIRKELFWNNITAGRDVDTV